MHIVWSALEHSKQWRMDSGTLVGLRKDEKRSPRRRKSAPSNVNNIMDYNRFERITGHNQLYRRTNCNNLQRTGKNTNCNDKNDPYHRLKSYISNSKQTQISYRTGPKIKQSLQIEKVIEMKKPPNINDILFFWCTSANLRGRSWKTMRKPTNKLFSDIRHINLYISGVIALFFCEITPTKIVK